MNAVSKSIALFLLCVVFMVSAEEVAEVKEPVKTTSQSVQWLDVRSWPEHQIDHIEGDLRIHVADIEAKIGQYYPDKTRLINVYCAAGVRAERAVQTLRRLGYTNVANVGGIDQARALRKLPF